MKTTIPAQVRHIADAHLQLRADTALPDGVAGRVSGVALTYEVVDSYGTMFARGCTKATIERKVKARKVPLLMDHERRTGAHVGVVSLMQEMGDSLMMTADLFDTPEGRAALEYVKAVIGAGATTGFSIGFAPRRTEAVTVDGQIVERFLEIELREVSITPMPAVPGADITSARHDDGGALERSDEELLTAAAIAALNALPVSSRAALLAQYTHEQARPEPDQQATPHSRADCPATDPAPAPVDARATDVHTTMAHRLAAVRATY